MRTTISLCLALVALTSARAEVFRPGAVAGRAVAAHGRVHGDDHRRHDSHRGRDDHRRHDGHRTSIHVGLGFGGYRHYGYHGHHRHHGHWAGHRYHYSPYRYVPTYAYYPGYGYDFPYYSSDGYYRSGSAAANGLVLGALAGGIIGNNSGEFRHNGWRGAAWGAGLGWLLGSVFDANRRRPAYTTVPATTVQTVPTATVQTQPAPAPQQVTIINNYYNTSTPMSSANTLFGR